jgi:hypothetical protein
VSITVFDGATQKKIRKPLLTTKMVISPRGITRRKRMKPVEGMIAAVAITGAVLYSPAEKLVQGVASAVQAHAHQAIWAKSDIPPLPPVAKFTPLPPAHAASLASHSDLAQSRMKCDRELRRAAQQLAREEVHLQKQQAHREAQVALEQARIALERSYQGDRRRIALEQARVRLQQAFVDR